MEKVSVDPDQTDLLEFAQTDVNIFEQNCKKKSSFG